MCFSVLNSIEPQRTTLAKRMRLLVGHQAEPHHQHAPRAFAPGQTGRASTRCFAARAGEVRLLANCVTQRKMQAAQARASGVRPNPSIERTSPGKPGAASHVKR